LGMYETRRQHEISAMEKELHSASQRVKFILAILNESLLIRNVSKDEVHRQMESLGFDDAEARDSLLNMNLISVTKERVEALHNKMRDLASKVEALKQTTPAGLWRSELDALENELERSKLEDALSPSSSTATSSTAKSSTAKSKTAKSKTANSKTKRKHVDRDPAASNKVKRPRSKPGLGLHKPVML